MTATSPLLDYFLLAESRGGELRVDPKDCPPGASRAFCIRLRAQINSARVNLRRSTLKSYPIGDPNRGVTPWDSYLISLRQDPKTKEYYLLISLGLAMADVVLSDPITGEVIAKPEVTYDPGQNADGNKLSTPLDSSDLL